MLTECSFEIAVFPNLGSLQSEYCAWGWPPVRHWGHGTASLDEAAILHLTRVSDVLHHQITGASLSPCLYVVQLPTANGCGSDSNGTVWVWLYTLQANVTVGCACLDKILNIVLYCVLCDHNIHIIIYI